MTSPFEHHYNRDTTPERVVVLGASGFVGGAIAARAETAGIAVVRLSRADVDLCAADCPAKLSAILRPGDSLVAASAQAPCKDAAMLANNMVIVRNLIEAIKNSPIAHLINISSDAVYPDEPVPLHERTPMAPGSTHGAMHLAREIALEAELSMPILHLRPTLIYGHNDPHNGYGPNRFLRLAQNNEDIKLFGEGEERRDHVLIDDLADISLKALLRKTSGALNAVTSEVHSFREIAELIVSICKSRSKIKGSPRVGEMPHKGYRPFDNSAVRAAFPGFQFTPLDAGLRQVATQMNNQATGNG